MTDAAIQKSDAWRAMAEKIDKVQDANGKPIDAGIRSAVILLNLLGINTTGSCEGHLERECTYPWIHVFSPHEFELCRQVVELTKEGKDEKEVDKVHQQRKRMNRTEQQKLHECLEKFYSKANENKRQVDYDCMLRISGFRLQSNGADFQEVRTKEVREQKFRQYCDEMKAFVDFLEKEYFGYDGFVQEQVEVD